MDSIDNINAILIQHRVFLQYTDDWPRDHLSKWPFHQHTYLAHVLIYQYWGWLRKWKVVIIRLDFFLPRLALTFFAETYLIYLTILNPGGKKQTWISFLSKSQFDVKSPQIWSWFWKHLFSLFCNILRNLTENTFCNDVPCILIESSSSLGNLLHSGESKS